MSDTPSDPRIGSTGDSDPDRLVEVLKTSDLGEFEVARGLLEASGIPCASRGDDQARMLGIHIIAGILSRPDALDRPGAIRLLVAQRDESLARELLDSPPEFESVPELVPDDES